MREIDDKSVDLILCDLPYGTTACKWDTVISFEHLWECYDRICKENAAVVLFCCQPFTSILGASNINDLKYSWVWEKTKPTNFLQSKRMPLRGFEDILVFYKKQPTYNPQGLLAVNKKVKNTGTKNRHGAQKENGDQSFHGHISNSQDIGDNSYNQEFTNFPRGIILQAQNGNSKSLHPTQKPIELCEYLIKTYTQENDLVLDNCFGSGSTLVAAKNLNRQFIGIEKEEKYFNITKERLNL
jgi:site-specific DNA-methyltransferase (adenine-specific)